MKPFVLIAALRTPIALQRPLHLDGLLLAAAFKLDPSKMASLDGLIASFDGIPKASAGFLIYEGHGAPVQPITRVRAVRMNSSLVAMLHADPKKPATANQIDAMSPYRARLTPHRPIAAIREVAWQATGDADAVLQLARSIDNLGAMHGQGFGEVLSWRTESCSADPAESGWRKGERLLRRLPIERTTKMFAMRPQNVLEDIAAPAPPYWMKDVVIPVLEPTLASLIMQEHAAREILAF